MSNKKKRKQPPFVALYRNTMKSRAYKELSVGARAVLDQLTFNYNTNMQNSVYLSARRGAEELNCKPHSVLKWIQELQHYGFIVMTRGASLGPHGSGNAPHYRLTDRPYAGDPATNDFQNWDGEIFDPKKQDPVPLGGTPRAEKGYIGNSPPAGKNGNKCAEKGYIETPAGCAEKGHIASFTSPQRSRTGMAQETAPAAEEPEWTTPQLTELPWNEQACRYCGEVTSKSALTELCQDFFIHPECVEDWRNDSR
jgi:hypothetical protein